ncbi:radical SAM protein [Patescibacteria group bacterium]
MSIELVETRVINQGRGFVSRTKDNFKVLSADKVFYDEYEGIIKRKIGLSLCSGCQVGCTYCFTGEYSKFRQLTSSEIVVQAEMILEKQQVVDGVSRTNISLKQMGDPLTNPQNTLKAIEKLHDRYPNFEFIVSTSGPECNVAEFFAGLRALQDRGIKIRLQFSCHTTSDFERVKLSPRIVMMDYYLIMDVVRIWSKEPVTLNFVLMKGFEYDVSKLARIFDPRLVFIKVNYIDQNRQTNFQGLENAENALVSRFIEELKQFGFNYAFRQG